MFSLICAWINGWVISIVRLEIWDAIALIVTSLQWWFIFGACMDFHQTFTLQQFTAAYKNWVLTQLECSSKSITTYHELVPWTNGHVSEACMATHNPFLWFLMKYIFCAWKTDFINNNSSGKFKKIYHSLFMNFVFITISSSILFFSRPMQRWIFTKQHGLVQFTMFMKYQSMNRNNSK